MQFSNLSNDQKVRLKAVENELRQLSKNICNSELSKHYELKETYQNKRYQVTFGFRKSSDLDYKLKEYCFEIFRRHFSVDGIETSLSGIPQTSLSTQYPHLR